MKSTVIDIHLREPLKRLGDFTVPLAPAPRGDGGFQVKVAPEGEVIVGHMTPEQEAELAKTDEEPGKLLTRLQQGFRRNCKTVARRPISLLASRAL